MRDDFVGNIGDYGKYGLLRALTGVHPPSEPRLSLGVIWYRTPRARPRSSNFDYLGQEHKYKDCDEELFHELRAIDDDSRCLELIEERQILGSGCRFFHDLIPQDGLSREDWFDRALKQVETQDIILLDPDRGLRDKYDPDFSEQDASIDELGRVLELGKIAVVYHHHEGFPFQHRSRDLAQRIKDQLRQELLPEALLYEPGRMDCFIVVPDSSDASGIHQELIYERVQRLVDIDKKARGH